MTGTATLSMRGPLQRVLGRVELTNREKVPRSNGAELMGSQCHYGLGMSRSSNEFHFHRVSRIDLNYRTNVPLLQAEAWEVYCYNNSVQSPK